MSIRLVKVGHKASNAAAHGDREQSIARLKLLLIESFRLRHEGVPFSKLSYAQGYADGYMKLMLDTGIVSEREMLSIVAEARRGVDGPATRAVSAEPKMQAMAQQAIA